MADENVIVDEEKARAKAEAAIVAIAIKKETN